MAFSPRLKRDFTKCTLCRCLCLGPTILPCGHCSCRRCYLKILVGQLQDQKCCSCGTPTCQMHAQVAVDPVPDPVVEDLVHERLAKETEIRSCRCCDSALDKPTRVTHVCLDCGDFLCDMCASSHIETSGHPVDALPNTFSVLRSCVVRVGEQVTGLVEKVSNGPNSSAREPYSSFNVEATEVSNHICQLQEEERRVDLGIKQLQELKECLTVDQAILEKYACLLIKPQRLSDNVSTLYLTRVRQVREESILPGKLKCFLCGNESDYGKQSLQGVPEVHIEEADQVLAATKITICNIGREQESICTSTADIHHAKVVYTAPSVTVVNIDSGYLHMEVLKHQSENIKENENMVIFSVDWTKLKRIEELEKEKETLDQQIKELMAKKNKVNQKLQAEKRKSETIHGLLKEETNRRLQMEAVIAEKDEIIQEIHAKVMTFVTFILRLERNDERLADIENSLLDKHRLPQVVWRLFHGFGVRLIAVDSDLNFVMEAPETLTEGDKHALQKVLDDLLPEVARGKVPWHDVTGLESSRTTEKVNWVVGRPSAFQTCSVHDVQVVKEQSDVVKTVVENYKPQKKYYLNPKSEGDTVRPNICSIIVTSDGLLVMADCKNIKVKVAGVSDFNAVRDVKLSEKPWGLAQIQSDVVAVTADNRYLCLVVVASNPVYVRKYAKTQRQYRGIGAVDEKTLVVGCSDEPCSIDVIALDGTRLREVVPGGQIETGLCPFYMLVVDRDVLLSDRNKECILRVELSTGRVTSVPKCPEMRDLRQIACDQEGNLYVASYDAHCVLLKGSNSQQWQQLLSGRHHGERILNKPVGVYVTGSWLWVSWHDAKSLNMSVEGYKLTI